MHNKNNKRAYYSTLQRAGFITTAGILTILAGCGQNGKDGKDGTNGTNGGISGGATITAASCDTTNANTLNISITNSTTETLTLLESGIISNAALLCSIFNSSVIVTNCSVNPFGTSGVLVTSPLPIGTTVVSLTCESTSCDTSIIGFACEGMAYAPPTSATPGLAFELDNIFGTIPPPT